MLGYARLLAVAGILAVHHVVGLQRTHCLEYIGCFAVHSAKAL